jgi:hypothetical protein
MIIYDDINNREFRVTKFIPKMNLALEWFELSNGNYNVVDRGREEDYYETEITTHGTEYYINDLCVALQDNFLNRNSIIYMSGLASNEHIFGENINHTIISGVITNWEAREATSWRGFKLTISLRVLSPTFIGISRFPNLSTACVQHGYKGDSIVNFKINDTYNGEVILNYLNTKTNIFEFDLNLTLNELKDLRQWIRSNRAESFLINSINGITYPFGPTLEYPHICKLIGFKEKEFFGINRKIVTLTLHKET